MVKKVGKTLKGIFRRPAPAKTSAGLARDWLGAHPRSGWQTNRRRLKVLGTRTRPPLRRYPVGR